MITKYLEYNENQVVRIGCMCCNETIGKINEKTGKLVYWTNYKVYPITLEDGSYQNVLLCKDCFRTFDINSEDKKDNFDETRRWGWKKHYKAQGIEEKVAKRMVEDFCRSKKIIGKLEA